MAADDAKQYMTDEELDNLIEHLRWQGKLPPRKS